jgi:acetoin utilization protein AcuC
LIGSEVYRQPAFEEWHPLRAPRVPTVLDLSRALGWLGPDTYLVSPRARPEALTHWHSPAYITALQAAEATGTVSAAVRARHGLGTPSNPVYPAMFRRPATSAGGVMLAAELVRGGGRVHVPGGGTHHGMPDRAGGFCYINDPVLCILTLRRIGIGRIAYVDIDAHHPDGVEYAFAQDPETLLVSVHEERRWPFTGALEDRGAGNVFNLPVPRGFNDSEMALVRDELILPRVTAFRPEAIVLQCGADAVEEDPLSRLSLSNNAHWAVVAALVELAPRFIVLGGGGYNPWSVGRLWTGVWATLAGHEIPDRLPPGAEAVLRALNWRANSRGRNPPDHWFTTLRDTARDGPIREEVRARLSVLTAR